MKRFFAVICLAMCITIGGAYAAWTYSAGDAIDSAQDEALIVMEEKTFDGAHGTFSIESTLDLKMDQGPNYQPTLVPNGTLTLVFTPADNAPDEIKENGTSAKLTITSTFDESILTFTDYSVNITQWTERGTSFIYEIPAGTLAGNIVVKPRTLNTSVLYDDYEEDLEVGRLLITMSEPTPAPAN